MVEYLSGNRIQGSSTKVSEPPQTSWKELARVVGSSGTSLDTGTFTAKDNLMILIHSVNGTQMLTYNNDSGANYANRRNEEGGSDSTNMSSQNNINFTRNAGEDMFIYGDLVNAASSEKMGVYHQLSDASNTKRQEWAHKWANTSNQITRVTLTSDSGNYDANDQLIVLGCDNDESDSGSVFWQKIADETSTSAGDFTVSFTAKKYLWVQASGEADGNNRTSWRWRFNSDSTSGNYKFRRSDEDGSDSHTGDSYISVADTLGASGQSGNSGNTQVFTNAFIVNPTSYRKLGVYHSTTNQPDTQGGSSTMDRAETTAMWTNTSEQITSITVTSTGDSFPAGLKITVWGSD